MYIAEHEIVHTMGYFHTTLIIGDFHPAGLGCPGAGRASRVAYHAAIMYSRPAGNRDPDHDPAGFAAPASLPEPIVIRCGGS